MVCGNVERYLFLSCHWLSSTMESTTTTQCLCIPKVSIAYNTLSRGFEHCSTARQAQGGCVPDVWGELTSSALLVGSLIW